MSEDEREQRLADVLSQLADSILQGEPLDFDSVCRDHPDLAGELRELWGTVLVSDTAAVAAEAEYRDEQNLPDNVIRPHDHAANSEPIQFGDYELIEEVGRGGMGVVYRAKQSSLNREVAVKMILRGRLASESDRQRFRVEAEATAKLEHPGIVPVYEVGEIDNRPFFSMQYIEGQTLADYCRSGPLPPRDAAQILSQIARAIQFAHDHGVLHRDLKPSNIIVRDDGQVMITDFGLAKEFDTDIDLTRSGMMVGTPAYMSPEQAGGRKEQLGPASDVYSLGSMLYFTLTGRPPFLSDSPVELVMLVLEQDPLPPRVLRPSLDRDLEIIVIRCLQKPVDLRYPSAGNLADDLDAYLADETISARSGQFAQILARVFRETHHAAVLENWGKLWIWHSLVLLIACLLTWELDRRDVQERWIYISVWTLGLGAWAAVFWRLRQRIGPVTFIERQVAHVWGASMIAIGLLFPLEWWLELKVLTLSPLLGVISAMVFVIKAGMLTGRFYFQAIALLVTSLVMAIYPGLAHLAFGIVGSACFFIPGYHYARLRSRH